MLNYGIFLMGPFDVSQIEFMPDLNNNNNNNNNRKIIENYLDVVNQS